MVNRCRLVVRFILLLLLMHEAHCCIDNLPVDELQTILEHLLRALFRNGTTQDMRGDLYVTLIYYLRHTQPHQESATIAIAGTVDETVSTASGIRAESFEETLGWETEKQATQQLHLRNRCMAQLRAQSERLIELISVDAANSRDNLRWYEER